MKYDIKALDRAKSGDGDLKEAEPVSLWIVDDRDDLRGLLRQALEGHGGLDCHREFPSAESALAALRSVAPPQVILLDHNMRGMSGLQALPHLQELAPESRVLMLTTFFDAPLKAAALKAGAAGFLLKSYSIVTIAEKIHEALRCERVAETEDSLEGVALRTPTLASTRFSPGLRLGRWLRCSTRFEDAMDRCAGTP